jgi:hypothetical protein
MRFCLSSMTPDSLSARAAAMDFYRTHRFAIEANI